MRMRIEVEISDHWVERARKLRGSMDLQVMLEVAFREFVLCHEAKERLLHGDARCKSLLSLAGQIQFFDGYDPEAEFCGARPPATDEEKKSW
jgi:hypothetical protein